MIPAALLAAATAFNLVCTGTESHILERHTVPGLPDAPLQLVLRIDLAQGRWCENECSSTLPIASIAATRIALQDDRGDLTSKQLFLNREDGSIHRRDQTGDFVVVQIGQCRPAPFTGFPTRKF